MTEFTMLPVSNNLTSLSCLPAETCSQILSSLDLESLLNLGSTSKKFFYLVHRELFGITQDELDTPQSPHSLFFRLAQFRLSRSTTETENEEILKQIKSCARIRVLQRNDELQNKENLCKDLVDAGLLIAEAKARITDHDLGVLLSGNNLWICLFTMEAEDISEIFAPASNKHQNTLLHRAVQYGNGLLVESLLTSGALTDINTPNEAGDTPLHIAASMYYADYWVIHSLLAFGAEINRQNLRGETPLHKAASRFHPGWRTAPSKYHCAIVQLLLKNKAQIDVKDNEGNTPLHAAAAKANHWIVKVLKNAGADCSKRNKNGLTPLDCLLKWIKEDSSVSRLGPIAKTIKSLNEHAKLQLLNREKHQAALEIKWPDGKQDQLVLKVLSVPQVLALLFLLPSTERIIQSLTVVETVKSLSGAVNLFNTADEENTLILKIEYSPVSHWMQVLLHVPITFQWIPDLIRWFYSILTMIFNKFGAVFSPAQQV